MRVVSTLLVGLFVAGAAPTIRGPHSQAAGQAPGARRIWSAIPDDASFCGALITDGKLVPYGNLNDGDLYVYDTTSMRSRRLTRSANPGDRIDKPMETFASGCWAVSPDGTQLAYSWHVGNRASLRLINLTSASAEPRELFADATVTAVEPTGWSPDGQWIGFSLSFTDRPFAEVRIVSVKDGNTRVVKTTTRPDENVGDVYFSPDGRFLLYEYFVNNWNDQSITIVDRTRLQEVSTIKLDGQTVGWIDAGVAYVQSGAASDVLFALPIEDGKAGKPRQLTSELANIEAVGVSASGVFAYRHWLPSEWRSTVASVDFANGRVLSPPVTIVVPDNDVFPASWSRDGRHLALIGLGKDGARTLIVRSTETGATRIVKPDLASFQGADLSPDGRTIAMMGTDKARHRGLFLTDAQTGAATLAAEAASLFHAWSSDGTKIYFERPIDDGSGDVWIVERALVNGAERNLHRASGSSSARMERGMSADGQTLFYLAPELAKGQRRNLIAKDTAGGRETTLVTEHGLGPLNVAPGGAFIVATVDDVLTLIPASGGTPRPVPPVGGLDVTILSWAPDERSFIARTMTGPDPRARSATIWWVPVDGRPARKLDLSYGATSSAVGSTGSAVAFVEQIKPSNAAPELWMLSPGSRTAGGR